MNTEMPVRLRSVSYLTVSSGLLVTLLVVPDDLTAGIAWFALQAATLIAIVVGIVHHRPTHSAPWWLLAVALVALTAPGLIDPLFWSMSVHAFGDPAAVVIAALGLPLVGLAASRMAHAQGAGHDYGPMLDSTILTIAFIAVLWETGIGRFGMPEPFVLEPRTLTLGVAAVTSWAAAAAIRLLLAGGKRAFSGWAVLVASLLVLAGSSTLVVAGLGGGIPRTTSLLWGAGYVAIGLSALHPSMIVLGDPAEVADVAHVRVRSTLLAFALLAPPAAILLRYLATGESAVVSAVATALLTPLVALRFVDLLRQTQRDHELARFQMAHDALTQLPNRRLLDERLDQALHRRTAPDRHVAVLFLDLNGFKAINDAHGHAAGDHLLAETARRLTLTCRAGDTVARFAGDEFVVVLDDVTREEAVTTAERLHDRLVQPVKVGTAELRVGASFGIALSGDLGVEPEVLMSAADMAMYTAKQAADRNVEIAPSPTGERDPREPSARL